MCRTTPASRPGRASIVFKLFTTDSIAMHESVRAGATPRQHPPQGRTGRTVLAGKEPDQRAVSLATMDSGFRSRFGRGLVTTP